MEALTVETLSERTRAPAVPRHRPNLGRLAVLRTRVLGGRASQAEAEDVQGDLATLNQPGPQGGQGRPPELCCPRLEASVDSGLQPQAGVPSTPTITSGC